VYVDVYYVKSCFAVLFFNNNVIFWFNNRFENIIQRTLKKELHHISYHIISYHIIQHKALRMFNVRLTLTLAVAIKYPFIPGNHHHVPLV
jgi:hypothetical protein